MDAVKRHSRSTCPVSMRPLHAGTQEKRVRGGKTRSSTNTQKKQIAGGKSSATALTLTGNSTPAITHKHHRSAVSPRPRRQPHNKRTHHQQSPTNGRGREATHRHRLQFNPTANGIRPRPAAGTQRTTSEQSPKEPHAEAIPHPSMTRRLTSCGHTECGISSELILRPSLENVSVSDGHKKRKWKMH
ncbi:hypothetical protein TcG_10558 [Trypanosoma cruzi]|nr:hypothetical protein TcG_10558 [Trypanosoma cruzi]